MCLSARNFSFNYSSSFLFLLSVLLPLFLVFAFSWFGRFCFSGRDGGRRRRGEGGGGGGGVEGVANVCIDIWCSSRLTFVHFCELCGLCFCV